MLFATVITPNSNIASNAPVFWFYYIVFRDAFHHVAAIAGERLFCHRIYLRHIKNKNLRTTMQCRLEYVLSIQMNNTNSLIEDIIVVRCKCTFLASRAERSSTTCPEASNIQAWWGGSWSFAQTNAVRIILIPSNSGKILLRILVSLLHP